MYWTFYRSTIILNSLVSFLIALITGEMLLFFPICYATIGLLAVFLYKEIARPNNYYFYYNQGISKVKLMMFCFLVNIVVLLVLIAGIYIYIYVA